MVKRRRLIKKYSPLFHKVCRLKDGMTRRSNKMGYKLDYEYFTSARIGRLILDTKQCAMCKEPLSYYGSNKRRMTIDRIDNDKGYVKGNVCILCQECNRIKGAVTLEVCKRIIAYIQNPGNFI